MKGKKTICRGRYTENIPFFSERTEKTIKADKVSQKNSRWEQLYPVGT